MKMNIPQKTTLWFMAGLLIFWSALFFSKTTSGNYNFLFSFLMGILPLVGGLFSMIKSWEGEGPKGFLNKGVFWGGLGLFLWGCGELVWSYYNFFGGVAAPYPSIADLGFAPSVFLYSIGVVFLARAAGADVGLHRRFAKLFIAAISILVFLFSYYILVVVVRQGVLVTAGDPILKAVLDIAYPVGDFFGLTAAVVLSGLSFRYIKNEYRFSVVCALIGLAVMFFADSVFSFTTSIGSYYNGNFGDLIFTIALFLITFGILGFTE
jgi:hypothetical protein